MPDKEINVTTYAGHKGEERPKSFPAEGKIIEVVGIVKMWIEEGRDDRRRKRFFTIQGSDGKAYTLFYDELFGVWFLKDALKKIA